MTVNDAEELELRDWAHKLEQALQVLDLKVDPSQITELADRSSDSIGPRAGAISAFVAGYAAGAAATDGPKSVQEAVDAAVATVHRLCDEGTTAGPDRTGWAATGQ